MPIYNAVDLTPDAFNAVQTLLQSQTVVANPGFRNILNRIGNKEFGANLDLQGVIDVLTRHAPDLVQVLQNPVASAQAQDLNNMSDTDLLAEAGRLGIDTAQFNVPSGPVEAALQNVSGLTPGISQAATPFDVQRDQVSLPEDVRREVAGVFGSQRALGQEELRRQTVELAGQRGLGFGDADIPQRVAARLAELETGLRGQESQALLSLAEQARQNLLRQREFGANLGENQRQFNLGNLLQQSGLQQQSLLGRGNLFENRRQFENQLGFNQQQANRDFLMSAAQFQNNLRQQAFMNRQALSGQAGQVGLGLAGARFGVPTGFSTFDPRLANAQNQIGTGLIGAGVRNIGSFLGF